MCEPSPPYDPVIVIVDPPVPLAGVNLTLHVAVAPVPDRVHEVPGFVNVPDPLAVNDTVPVGVVFAPLEVSVTVAVHVVYAPVPTVTVLGEQDTPVVVGCPKCAVIVPVAPRVTVVLAEVELPKVIEPVLALQ